MPEPTLSQIHSGLVERIKHDKRLRAVEVEPAEMKAILAGLPCMEDRIMAAVEANKPKSPWPAVAALAGVMAVVLVIAAQLYG